MLRWLMAFNSYITQLSFHPVTSFRRQYDLLPELIHRTFFLIIPYRYYNLWTRIKLIFSEV